MAVTLGPGGGQSIPDEQTTFIPGVSYRAGEGLVSVPTNGGSSGGLRSVSETRRQERAREAAYRKAQLEAQQKAQAEKLKAENAKKLAEYKKTQLYRARQIQEVKRAAAEKQAQLTAKERASLNAREQIRLNAIQRNRPYTRYEAQRFIQQRGGSIGALRSATAKGYSIPRTEEIKMTIEEKNMRNALNSAEKLFPTGVKFQRDSSGNILNIDNNNKGTNEPIENIVNYVPAEKLVRLGLGTLEETAVEKAPSIFGAFSPKKFLAYRETQRQDYYDLYGLEGKNRNFYTLANKIATDKNPSSLKQVQKLATQNLVEDLNNPNTQTRARAVSIIATLGGGVVFGTIVGTAYNTPLKLAGEKGYDTESFEGLSWKDVAKKGGIELAKNAAEAYLMMKLFGLGEKAISSAPGLVRNVVKKVAPNSNVVLKVLKASSKPTKLALKKGLDIMAVQYLSTIGTSVVRTGKNILDKKYKTATVEASKVIGQLVGLYGEKAVKSALRKVLLKEDPRLIITRGTKKQPFAIEPRSITIARLNRAKNILKKSNAKKITLYHGTTETSAKKILRGGIRGKAVVESKSNIGTFWNAIFKKRVTYLTDNLAEAKRFASKGGGKVIKIRVTKAEFDKIKKETIKQGYDKYQKIFDSSLNPNRGTYYLTSSKISNKDIAILGKRFPKIVSNVKYAKASPVREPRTKKIVTPENRKARGVKIDVPTPAGYAAYAVGKDVYLVPEIFLNIRKGNTPKTYYKKWIEVVRKKGLLPTLKELGLPRTYKPTIYKGSGEYLPRKKGESLKAYYARAQKIANKLKIVQIVAAPKTVLNSPQPEMEIKTIYPNPKGVRASVTRVKVGKDAFGHTVIVEIVAPKSFIERFKFKIREKVEFKKGALKYLTNTESKIARDLAPRVIENYDYYYVKKLKGYKAVRNHSLTVERNVRRIVEKYKIKLGRGLNMNKVIRATARLHDILKLRGLNVKDEPLIRKMIKNGDLDSIGLIKNLNRAEKNLVANTIGYHQDTNPRTAKAILLNKFTRAFINADRLDITRYGIKVKEELLFNLKNKTIPERIKVEFKKLAVLKNKGKGFTVTLRKRYNALVKKFPQLKGTIEDKIIAENKAKYKKLSPKQKAKVKALEKEYTDYKEAFSKYQASKKGKKISYGGKYPTKYKTKSTKYKGKYPVKKTTTYKTKTPKYKSKYPGKYTPKKPSKVKTPTYKRKYSPYKYIPKKPSKKKYPPYKYIPRRPTNKKSVIPFVLKKFTQRTLPRKVDTFYVVEKVRGKFKKLYPKPLTSKDARDFAVHSIDNRLSKTAFLIPLGKTRKVIQPPKNIQGYYGRNSRKVRPYRIKFGKKKQLVNGFIEKRKYFQDTVGERTSARNLRKNTPIKRNRIKRKISPARRKQLILQLKKARAAKRRK